MKLDEFKAWFEGFTEDMDRAPTAKQWKRIKERVAEIDGVAISYPVYVERYWPAPRPWYMYPTWSSAGCTSNTVLLSSNLTGAVNSYSQCVDGQASSIPFDGVSAMFAAGKAEAASFSA